MSTPLASAPNEAGCNLWGSFLFAVAAASCELPLGVLTVLPSEEVPNKNLPVLTLCGGRKRTFLQQKCCSALQSLNAERAFPSNSPLRMFLGGRMARPAWVAQQAAGMRSVSKWWEVRDRDAQELNSPPPTSLWSIFL